MTDDVKRLLSYYTARQLAEIISAVKGALNTEEDGVALVEVARNAYRAELTSISAERESLSTQ